MKRSMTAVGSFRRKTSGRWRPGPRGKESLIRAAADEEGKYVSWTKLAVPHVSELIKYTHTFNCMSIELC